MIIQEKRGRASGVNLAQMLRKLANETKKYPSCVGGVEAIGNCTIVNWVQGDVAVCVTMYNMKG